MENHWEEQPSIRSPQSFKIREDAIGVTCNLDAPLSPSRSAHGKSHRPSNLSRPLLLAILLVAIHELLPLKERVVPRRLPMADPTSAAVILDQVVVVVIQIDIAGLGVTVDHAIQAEAIKVCQRGRDRLLHDLFKVVGTVAAAVAWRVVAKGA